MRDLMKLSWHPFAFLLSACAAPHSFMGLSIGQSSLDSELHRLARKAAAGDDASKIMLAQRLAGGNGLPQDVGRACNLLKTVLEHPRNATRTTYMASPIAGQMGPYSFKLMVCR